MGYVQVDQNEITTLRKLARIVNKLVNAEGPQRYWIWEDELLPALESCRQWADAPNSAEKKDNKAEDN